MRLLKSLFGTRSRNDAKTVEARYRQLVANGNEARDAGAWDDAIRQYALALAFKPQQAAVRVQIGHALKEVGRFVEAEAAYRQAATDRPHDPDTQLQLGHILKLQGRHDEALAAYAAALEQDPQFGAARNELIAAGARHLLPGSSFGSSAITQALLDLSAAAKAGSAAAKSLEDASVYPMEAWDAFRRAFPITPPPAGAVIETPVVVIIDAANATSCQIRMSLVSLLDQSIDHWTAIVRGAEHADEHSVASLAYQDDRICFQGPFADPASVVPDTALMVICDAGLVLDAEALAWLLFAWQRTSAAFGYADHDHHTHDWRRGRVCFDPMLQWVPDPWFFEHAVELPALVAVAPAWRSAVLPLIVAGQGAEMRRRLLTTCLGEGGRGFHIPRVLSSVRQPSPARMPVSFPEPEPPIRSGDQPIHVIIPTRDGVELLKACVQSLRAKVARPDLLTIEIVDNRSQAVETQNFLDELREELSIRISRFDEPFNWARVNNQAAENASSRAILVFANNDVEVLTPSWDDRVRDVLSDARVGVVGARLLYPDRTIQHAGVVLGANQGRPVHEGVGQPSHAPGPNGRWRTVRQAGAVTGAFMALRGDVFEHLGGFDERLAIGYNDIEMCLKSRAAGLAVLYDPRIELIHHESKTRGPADPSKIAWDVEELTDFYTRWGQAVLTDPSLNPHWYSADERPFDGLCNPGRHQLLEKLRSSALANPWGLRPSTSADLDHG